MFRIRAAYVWILYEVEGFLLAQVAVGVNGPMLWSQRVMGKNAEFSASSIPLVAQPCH